MSVQINQASAPKEVANAGDVCRSEAPFGWESGGSRETLEERGENKLPEASFLARGDCPRSESSLHVFYTWIVMLYVLQSSLHDETVGNLAYTGLQTFSVGVRPDRFHLLPTGPVDGSFWLCR